MDTTLLELVDAAYELVELYKPESPAQEAWRLNWLEKARKAGAGPDTCWTVRPRKRKK
jgi:hypothetical protein